MINPANVKPGDYSKWQLELMADWCLEIGDIGELVKEIVEKMTPDRAAELSANIADTFEVPESCTTMYDKILFSNCAAYAIGQATALSSYSDLIAESIKAATPEVAT